MVKNMKKRINILICLIILFSLSMVSYAKLSKNNTPVVVSFNSPYIGSERMSAMKDDESLAAEEINKLKEYYNNDDVVGKIIIEGTDIEEAIMKTTDNNYYLSHDNYGKYQIHGSIYADYRTNLGDKKVLIFGHSDPGGKVPFNELEKYYDKNFYDSHQFITIVSEKGIDTYQIFSVYVETSDFTYMNLKIDDDTYNKYLRRYKYSSLYDTGVSIEDNDNIIILQTCSNSSIYKDYKRKFLLVIGKKINKEEKRWKKHPRKQKRN